jgi:hypothetical protein
MDLDPELAREWIAAARSLQATMERFPQRRAADNAPTSNTQTGNVSVRVEDHATPRLMMLSVFSAVLCAVLSIITLLGGGMLYLNMKDHLDAIYMMAPQLNQTEGKKP